MAAALGLFLLWLFATGKYKDWAALVIEPAKKVTTTASAPAGNTGGATGSWSSPNTSTASVDPSALIRTGSDWIGQLSGTMMTGGNDSNSGTGGGISSAGTDPTVYST